MVNIRSFRIELQKLCLDIEMIEKSQGFIPTATVESLNKLIKSMNDEIESNKKKELQNILLEAKALSIALEMINCTKQVVTTT